MSQRLKRSSELLFVGNAGKLLSRCIRRVDGWITPERLRLYPLFFVVASAIGVALSSAVRIAAPGIQGAWMPDYLAHWTGGKLLLSPNAGNLYDPQVQNALQQSVLGVDPALSWFVSPPIVALFYAPLALLPYTLSGMVWMVISTGLLVWSVLSLRTLAPGLMARKRRVVILAVLASPVVFELLGGGQDSAFILAVWLVGIRLLSSQHPVWAGAVFGLGCAKPQLVVVVPLLLLLTRNYRALGSFAAVGALFAGVSKVVAGPAGLQQWLAALASPLYMDQVQHGQAWKMLGLPSFVQAFLPPASESWFSPLLTVLPLPLGALILIVQILRLHNYHVETPAMWIAALATTAVFSPHLASYDAILFVPVIIYLLERRPTALVRVSTVAAFFLIYVSPALHFAAVNVPWPLSAVEAPWAALPLAAIWLESLRHLRASAVEKSGRVRCDTRVGARAWQSGHA